MNKDKLAKLRTEPIMVERAQLVNELLGTIPGEDVTREGLTETPYRVAKMYDELFAGYKQDGRQLLRDAMFENEHCSDMVVVKDIQFYSQCEHHIMPFFGTVSIAYIPQDGKIVGLSKLARLVEVYARRLQVQERMGQQIAGDIEAVMNPRALAVIIKAEHTCMTARGIQKPGAQTVTSCLKGSFFMDEKSRNELYNALSL